MEIRFSSSPVEVLQHLAEVTPTGQNYDSYHFDQASFDERIRELEALTGLALRPGQVQALQSLAEGKDVRVLYSLNQLQVSGLYTSIAPA
jgi:hypothetical protein